MLSGPLSHTWASPPDTAERRPASTRHPHDLSTESRSIMAPTSWFREISGQMRVRFRFAGAAAPLGIALFRTTYSLCAVSQMRRFARDVVAFQLSAADSREPKPAVRNSVSGASWKYSNTSSHEEPELHCRLEATHSCTAARTTGTHIVFPSCRGARGGRGDQENTRLASPSPPPLPHLRPLRFSFVFAIGTSIPHLRSTH